MKREIAASEGDNQTEPVGVGPELEDAEERNREWEMAKLQEEIRQAKKDKSKKKTEQDQWTGLNVGLANSHKNLP